MPLFIMLVAFMLWQTLKLGDVLMAPAPVYAPSYNYVYYLPKVQPRIYRSFR